MKRVVDETLDAMVRSLREHVDHAKQMGLTLTAQLLNMALIELRAELHDISPEDIEAHPGAKMAEHLQQRRLHAIAELR